MARATIEEMQQVLDGHPNLVAFNFNYDAIRNKTDERSITEKKIEARDRASMLPSGLTRHQESLLRSIDES